MSKRFLVVDDHEMMRDHVAAMLKDLGHTDITFAEDGKIALDKVLSAESPFDLVISDIKMPNMDGIEFLKAVRANDKDTVKSTPIIMATAEADTTTVLTVVKEGANNYVSKPYAKEVLEEKIKTVFEKLGK